jgi:hypothetical protein
LSEISLQSWQGGGRKEHKRLHDTARPTTSHPTFRLCKPLIPARQGTFVGKIMAISSPPAGWPELRQRNCPPPEGRGAF